MSRSTLIAGSFCAPVSAENATSTTDVVTGSLLGVQGTATVIWRADEGRPTIIQHPVSGDGELDDTFWSLLFGLIFYVPLLAAALGAPAGPGTDMLTGIGINDRFINSIRDHVTPGTWAVFAVAGHEVTDQLLEQLAHLRPDAVIVTSLE